jgi:hypothetical protein
MTVCCPGELLAWSYVLALNVNLGVVGRSMLGNGGGGRLKWRGAIGGLLVGAGESWAEVPRPVAVVPFAWSFLSW